MPAHRKPRCGFCLKELLNAKHVRLHIANTRKCRKAQVRETERRSQSPPVDSSSDANAGNFPDPNSMVADDMDAFAGHDYISSERVATNDARTRNQSHPVESEDVEDEDAPGRYAEEYNPTDVAHILRKLQTPFDTLKDDQRNAGLGEQPWAPFKDEEEWELAQFLIEDVSQRAANKYLKLLIVSELPLRKKALN